MTASFEARVSFNRQMAHAEKAPLEERRAAGIEWAQALKESPEIVVERIEWLIDGNYGWESYEIAREVIRNKRMNRPAWLGQTIANLEWNCPSDRARAGWNKLTPQEQESITEKIMDAIQANIDND